MKVREQKKEMRWLFATPSLHIPEITHFMLSNAEVGKRVSLGNYSAKKGKYLHLSK